MKLSRQRARRRSVLQDSELTTALLRVAAGAAMVGLHLVGSLSDAYGVAGPALIGASLYAVGAMLIVLRLNGPGTYPRGLTTSLTVLDNIIIILLAWLTGGVTSPIVAVLLLVITTIAARYGVRAAVACAVSDSAALVLIGIVGDGSLGLERRLHLAGWWTWLLIGGAVIAGITARAAFDYEAQLLKAKHRGAINRYERTLADRARSELESAAADRRDFLRVVAHELRTPIASIAALSQALNSRGSALSGDQKHEALGLIQSHASHLRDLLESVRDLAADMPIEDSPVRLADIDVRDVIASSASAALLPSERLKLDIATDLGLVRTDKEKLRRILTNLLENAGHYSEDLVEVVVAQDDESMRFEICDRGIGMTADVARQVFQKDFSFGSQRDSSGLGLWIVSELIRTMEGSVEAVPRDGGGLVMRVCIPRIATSTGMLHH